MNYMIESSLFLIDTNILVYAYYKTDPKKHIIANRLLEKCWKKEIKYIVSIQNLVELFFVITEKVESPIEFDKAKQIIIDITKFPNWIVINYDKKTILNAVNIKIEGKTSFWDSLLIATMLENNIFNIYTENEKYFNKIKNINVINPFK